MGNTQRIEDAIRGELKNLGFELVEFKLTRFSKRVNLSLYIDFLNEKTAKSMVSVEDCGKVSKKITAFIDKEALLGVDDYYLEVSSPGLNRKLNSLSDFERFAGKRVKLTILDSGKRKSVLGVIRGINSEYVVIESNGKQERILFSAIERARLRY